MGKVEKAERGGTEDIAARFSAVTRDLYTLAAQGRISSDIECIPVAPLAGSEPAAFLLQFGDAAIAVGADGAMFFVNGEGDGQQYYSVAPDLNNLVMASDIMQRSSVQDNS
jgi:hypothetical protein